MSGHTPGPWLYEDGDGYGAQSIWAGCAPSGHGKLGTKIASMVGDNAEVEPNARLIAAAPETAAHRDLLLAVIAELISAAEHLLTSTDARTRNLMHVAIKAAKETTP